MPTSDKRLTHKRKVLFLGGARYGRPLNATAAKKFKVLASQAEVFVIGFSEHRRPLRFTQEAHFYLLPLPPLPALRYALMLTCGTALALGLILRRRVHILTAQSPYEGIAAALAKIIARCFGRRVALVIETHGDFEQSLFLYRRVMLPNVARFLMRRIAQFVLIHADALRCISTSTCRQLEAWAPAKPIVQFPAWTDIEVFLQAGAEAVKDEKAPFILYAGVLTPLKGIHILLEAFGTLADAFPAVSLRLAGKEMDAKYGAKLREQAARLGLEQRIHFLDAMPQRLLAEQMVAAGVLVLPSFSEGLGRVVFEAMACGTPVIGSAVGGIPEIIADGETGFLVPCGDAAVLAERLRWMLQHPHEARAMGQKARAFAQEFFAPGAYEQNYARLWDQAVEHLESHI